ncbi:response regulator [Fulvivirga sp. 29W222]|uniref:Response regulator n=1 Tax=Fulvivirga marina TaxID=2494733 RepID=A0A937FXG5_9BACT|nr:response regulator [Fulvivirga marina]MBL6446318.1 response regulator [Fulvivirga marina]
MKKNILIIHKDDQARREMHDILSHFDFNLTYADDGLHGLYAAKSGNPDLIISEVNIAILNGLEMCKMIRREREIRQMPMIFLHEELKLDYISTAKNISASAFLIKPYLNNSLIYAIKKALKEEDLHVAKNKEPMRYEDCKIPLLAKIQYA